MSTKMDQLINGMYNLFVQEHVEVPSSNYADVIRVRDDVQRDRSLIFDIVITSGSVCLIQKRREKYLTLPGSRANMAVSTKGGVVPGSVGFQLEKMPRHEHSPRNIFFTP